MRRAHGGYSSADYVRRGVGAVHALAGYARLSEEYGAGLHTERQLAFMNHGREMARQCRELGVQVNFAPVADVNINPKNPVINTRSFGESPVNVADKVTAYAKGLEDGGVLSVSKHFPGHGDTDVDSHKALPTLPFTRARLDSVELYPFKKVIQEGLSGIMVGHLEVPAFEAQSGLPSSLSRNVVYDLLTRELKFRGHLSLRMPWR